LSANVGYRAPLETKCVDVDLVVDDSAQMNALHCKEIVAL
jgi:hypothetical protein